MYVPACFGESWNPPVALVAVVATVDPLGVVNTTWAPGTTAPVLSVTVPLIVDTAAGDADVEPPEAALATAATAVVWAAA